MKRGNLLSIAGYLAVFILPFYGSGDEVQMTTPNKVAAANLELPTYHCRQIGPHIITIDGKLDEPEWQTAALVDRFADSVNASPAKTRTLFRALRDDKYLYISFVCYTRRITATLTQHDGDLWREDVAEIFLDPEGKGKNYFEIEINPLNAIYDARIEDWPHGSRGAALDKSKPAYDSKDMRSAVVRNGPDEIGLMVWTVEAAIPFAEMTGAAHVPPASGDRWRMNLYRVDRASGDDIAWSPTGGWAHVPDRFGWLVLE